MAMIIDGKIIAERIKNELKGKLTTDEIEEAINKLVINSELFKPRRGYVQRV